MSNKEMPVTEAVTTTDEEGFVSYELAYHVLPTVTEGEVSTVRDRIVAKVEEIGGSVGAEETPKRVDLAYEIVKHIEGKNRRFTSAYFGWVRFTCIPDSVSELADTITPDVQILRHLLIRLNKVEEQNLFYYHEAIEDEQKISDVSEEDVEETDIDPNTYIEGEVTDVENLSDDTEVESTGTDFEDVTEDSKVDTKLSGREIENQETKKDTLDEIDADTQSTNSKIA